MKIIDSYIHVSNIDSFKHTAENISFLDYSSSGLKEEFQKAGIVAAVGMGLTEQEPDGFPDSNSPNPMTLNLEAGIPDFVAI